MKTKDVTWAIQSNLLSDNQMLAVLNAAIDYGCNIQDIIVIPFSDEFGNEIPDIGTNVIPYGSTKLNKMAQMRRWKGNWFNADTFRTEVWNHNSDDMLNADCITTTVGAVAALFEDVDDDEAIFIRPVRDLKEFNGTVTNVGEIKKWMASVYSGNFSFDENTEISIAPVQKLLNEVRYFIVGGKIVDGSMYRIHGQLLSQPITNSAVIEQAQELADKWLPHECCVMDVALTDKDELKIIEWNAINSSGFYYHDIPKIVRAMTDHLRNQNE